MALLVSVLALVPIRAWADPSDQMRTLETEHFHVHYYAGDEEVADRVARLAERAYGRVTTTFGHRPSLKTHVILNDRTDTSNGSANAIPFPRIRLFATAPGPHSVLGSFDDWLDILITHEFAHVVHIDTIHGLPRLVNAVFGFGVLGKTIAPNLVQPRWIVEGLATFEESDLGSQGRYRSAIFDMTLRMGVLEHRLMTIEQVSSGGRVFPFGTSAYLYGLHLMHHIATQYGRDKLAELGHLYGSRVIPLGLNRVLEDVIGADFLQVWEEFRRSAYRRFHAQARQIRARGLRQGRRITFSTADSAGGGHTRFPTWAYDDASLYFYEDTGHVSGGIRRVSAVGAELREGQGRGSEGMQLGVRSVLRTAGPARISFVGGTGHAVFDEIGVYDQRYRWSDLYLWHGVDARQREQITFGQRAREPDVSPDGRTVAYVRNDLAQSRLGFIDLATREHSEVAPLERYQQVSGPRWSPSGDQVAYSLWRAGGYRDLMVYDRASGKHARITASRHLDTAPTWSPDGRYLLFTSDRTGVFNVHAYDLQKEHLYQVTNVLGGAFEPTLSRDGTKLAYVGYVSTGFDLWVMPWDPETFLAALPQQDSLPPALAPEPEPQDWEGRPPSYRSTRYRPYKTFYPRSVLPSTFEFESIGRLTQAGLATEVSDVLGTHRLLGAFRMQSGRPAGSASYRYARRFANLSLGVGRSFATRDDYHRYIYDHPAGMFDDNAYFQSRYEERVTRLAGTASLPLLRPPNKAFSVGAELGYRFTRYETVGAASLPVDPNAPATGAPEVGDTAEMSLKLSVANVESFRFGYGNQRGRRLAIRLGLLDEHLGSDYGDFVINGAYTEYAPLPWRGHHVLAARLSGGASAGGLARRGAFSVGGFPETQDVVRRVLERTAYTQAGVLRGYRQGSYTGRYFTVINLEYRVPVLDVDRGPRFVPLFFSRVVLAGFSDWGYAWTGKLERDKIVGSVGASLIFALSVGFGERVDLMVQYAKGLDKEKGVDYFRAIVARSF